MACFLVPAAEAVVTTVAAKVMKKNAKDNEEKLSFATKLEGLNKLLWGGSLLLCYEHVWSGEITPFVPFLTAMNDPAETVVMLEEMAVYGGTMAVFMTAVWAVGCLVVDKIMKRPAAQVQLQ